MRIRNQAAVLCRYRKGSTVSLLFTACISLSSSVPPNSCGYLSTLYSLALSSRRRKEEKTPQQQNTNYLESSACVEHLRIIVITQCPIASSYFKKSDQHTCISVLL